MVSKPPIYHILYNLEKSMTNTAEKNKRILKNTLLLYFRMIIIMVINLYTSRVILSELGVDDFGIYNAVAGFITMFVYITGSMSTATQRFLTYTLGEQNFKKLANTFNMAVEIHVLMAITITIIGESIGLWFLFEKMTIPPQRFHAAFWVFQCAIISTIIMLISIPYNALIIAHEKMKTFAWISIIEASLKLIIAFLIARSPIDRLIFYAILLVCSQLIIRLIYGIYCKHTFKESNFNFFWDKKMFKEMSSFAGWSLFGCIAGAGQTQGLNMLLNIFFGPTVNAARGIAVQVQSTIQSFAGNFQTALNPQITKSYANKELDYTKFLLYLSSRISIFLLFIISLPILLEANQLLTWWLKTVPEHTVSFLKIILIIVMIEALANPIIVTAQATGKIKKYQIIVGCCLMLTFPIAYIFLKITQSSPELVFYIHLIIAIIAQSIRVILIKDILKFSLNDYFRTTILPCIKVCIPSYCICFLIKNIYDESFTRFIFLTFFSIILNLILIWLIGLEKKEKEQITTLIKAKLKK